MKLPDGWSRATPVFDDENLVSCAGLVPVMGLAEQAGLSELIDERVRFKASRVESAGVNPAGKLTSIIAGMAAGADCIEDLDVIRPVGCRGCSAGCMRRPRWASSCASSATATPCNWPRCCGPIWSAWSGPPMLPGISDRPYRYRLAAAAGVRPRQAGRQLRHTKIAGKQVLRKGLSPLATTITTAGRRAGDRRDPAPRRRAGSGKGAASMVTDAIRTPGLPAPPARSWSAATRPTAAAPWPAPASAGARFSLVLVKNSSVTRAIGTIPDHAWTPVHYPGAVLDPDTGELITDAEVAEVASSPRSPPPSIRSPPG